MKRILAIICTLALTLALTACGSTPADTASNDGPKSVKISMSQPQGHESYIRVQEFAEKVNADCDNAFDFQIYGSDSLGDWTLVSEELARGNVEMLVSSFEANNPMADFVFAPYLADNAEDVRVRFAEDSFIYNTISGIYKDAGVEFLGFEYIGMCGLSFGSKGAPAHPAELGGGEGKLIRIAGEDHIRLLMQGMGYNPSTVPWGDVYTSVQTGVIDGFNGAVASVAYQQFRDVISAFVDAKIMAEVQPICVSSKFWNTLTEEQQASFRTHAAELFNESIDQTEASESEYLDKLEEHGITVIRPSEAEIKALSDYTRTECWPCLEELMGTELYHGLLDSYNIAY